MPTKVSATEAVRTFSDLLNRIRYRGEEFVVERAGEPVCRMTPAAPARRPSLRELASLLREIPGADEDYASDVRRAIRKLDEQTKARLRVRAAQHGRSMEEEARTLLRTALQAEATPGSNLADAIRARFRRLGGVELRLPARGPIREPPKPLR